MSQARVIWFQAIRANQLLALDRRRGMSEFEVLLGEHPRDGMIYYERGEAWEYLGEKALALDDYQTAAEFLYAEHWRAVAKVAVARVQREPRPKASSSVEDLVRTIFHSIHALPYLPHEVRCDSLSAIVRLETEPRSTALVLRLCLEFLVLALLDGARIVYRDDDGLQAKIDLLANNGVVPQEIVGKMRSVRATGNRAAHPLRRTTRKDFDSAVFRFLEVAQWVNAKMKINAPRRAPG